MTSHRTTIDDSMTYDPQSALLPDLMENSVAHNVLSAEILNGKKKDEFISVLAVNLTEKLKSDMAELDAVQAALNKARASITTSLETTKSLSELVELVRQGSQNKRAIEMLLFDDQDMDCAEVPVSGDMSSLSETLSQTITQLSQRSQNLAGTTPEMQREYANLQNLLSKQDGDLLSGKSSADWSEKSILELFK